jgi:hypothetical protein
MRARGVELKTMEKGLLVLEIMYIDGSLEEEEMIHENVAAD